MDHRAVGALGRAQDVGQHGATCAARSCGSSRWTTSRRAPSRASGSTYSIPAGNMFAGTGTPNTRPEIYAMGFRQPFTVHTDPARTRTLWSSASTATTTARTRPTARPAGTCEWNLIDKPGFLRLAVLRRRQLDRQHDDAVELRDQRLDRAAVRLLAELRCRRTSTTHPPGGGTAAPADLSTAWPTTPRTGERRRRSGSTPEQRGQPEPDGLRRPERRRHAADHRARLPLHGEPRRRRRASRPTTTARG